MRAGRRQSRRARPSRGPPCAWVGRCALEGSTELSGAPQPNGVGRRSRRKPRQGGVNLPAGFQTGIDAWPRVAARPGIAAEACIIAAERQRRPEVRADVPINLAAGAVDATNTSACNRW
jgi:hypothetical protein